MDEQLRKLMGDRELTLVLDTVEATVQLEQPDGTKPRHPLKSLDQLYGQGTGLSSLETKNEIWAPLLTAIESELSRLGADDPQLGDGDVLLGLKALSMNPSADCADNDLAGLVQVALRLCLSLNDYSRQDVKMAIRKVIQSVQRHSRDAGRRGYLDFIQQYM
jgi:hypothetical protein